MSPIIESQLRVGSLSFHGKGMGHYIMVPIIFVARIDTRPKMDMSDILKHIMPPNKPKVVFEHESFHSIHIYAVRPFTNLYLTLILSMDWFQLLLDQVMYFLLRISLHIVLLRTSPKTCNSHTSLFEATMSHLINPSTKDNLDTIKIAHDKNSHYEPIIISFMFIWY